MCWFNCCEDEYPFPELSSMTSQIWTQCVHTVVNGSHVSFLEYFFLLHYTEYKWISKYSNPKHVVYLLVIVIQGISEATVALNKKCLASNFFFHSRNVPGLVYWWHFSGIWKIHLFSELKQKLQVGRTLKIFQEFWAFTCDL